MKKLFLFLGLTVFLFLGVSCSNENDKAAYEAFMTELQMTAKYPESLKISNFKKTYEVGDSLKVYTADVEARKDPTRTAKYKFEYVYLITEDQNMGHVTNLKKEGDIHTRYKEYMETIDQNLRKEGLSDTAEKLSQGSYDDKLKSWIKLSCLADRIAVSFGIKEGKYWE